MNTNQNPSVKTFDNTREFVAYFRNVGLSNRNVEAYTFSTVRVAESCANILRTESKWIVNWDSAKGFSVM